jgi:hypothetical protein
MNEKVIYTFIGGLVLISYYMINMKNSCKKSTGTQTDTSVSVDMTKKNNGKSNYTSGIFSYPTTLSNSIDNSDIDWNSVTDKINNK